MKPIRHLIECNCILAQFARDKNPPFHKFSVFSVLDDSEAVVEKHAQCENCGAIHRVTDLCKSTILPRREASKAVITIDDIKPSLSEELISVLERAQVSVDVWEYVQFVVENKLWGSAITISSEVTQTGEREGKVLHVIGNSLCKISTFSTMNEVTLG